MRRYEIRISAEQYELFLTSMLNMKSNPLGADAETREMIDALCDMLASAEPFEHDAPVADQLCNDFTA